MKERERGKNSIDKDIIVENLNIDILRLRKKGKSGWRCVDEKERLSLRKEMKEMKEGLKIKIWEEKIERKSGDDLIIEERIEIDGRKKLKKKEFLRRIELINEEKIEREKGRLKKESKGENLKDRIIVVGGIIG